VSSVYFQSHRGQAQLQANRRAPKWRLHGTPPVIPHPESLPALAAYTEVLLPASLSWRVQWGLDTWPAWAHIIYCFSVCRAFINLRTPSRAPQLSYGTPPASRQPEAAVRVVVECANLSEFPVHRQDGAALLQACCSCVANVLLMCC
jgi:hypothetical protein